MYEPEEEGTPPPPPVPKVPSAYGASSSIRLVNHQPSSTSYNDLHRLALSSPSVHDHDFHPSSPPRGEVGIERGRIVSASRELELGPDGEDVGYNNELFGVKGTLGSGGKDNETVLVTVRVRPSQDVNAWEIAKDGEGMYGGRSIRLADGSRKEWVFDRVLSTTSTNSEIYNSSALPHIHAAMSGYNAVIFAYGQTASGKTFTLSGSPTDPGVIPRAVEDVFRFIRGVEGKGREWVLRASYLELYNEMLCDLLGSGSGGGGEITIMNGKKEGEVQIHGLTEMVVTNVGEVRKVLELGERRRRTGVTDWNERSSRSHSVFRIVIESRLKGDDEDERAGNGGKIKNKATRVSCLSLIDLAGSEKATGSKERNAEGKYINQSLLTLKNVISKLAEQNGKKGGHVPFRDSKLTRLLQPSLSGDARISVICTINPSHSAVTESQSTLGFAAGVKRVVLNAQKTEVVDPAALIQQYQTEIADLKAKLAQKDAQLQIDGPQRRITVSDRREMNVFNSRLTELKRLILTSTTIEEDYAGGEAIMRPVSPSKIDHEQSTFALQEQLHIANAKLEQQTSLVAQLQADLALRPADPNQRVRELQTQVDQLTEMNKEYESNLLDPGRKVREDVEAEWRPKVQALEARAKEKDHFYKELYDDVHRMKSENQKLRERCDRLEADKQQLVLLFKELEDQALQSPPRSSQPLQSSSRQSHGRTQSTSASLKSSSNYDGSMPPPARPLGDSSRISSISMAKLASNLAGKTNSRVAGKGLRDDSLFDLAARAAQVDRGDDEFF